MSQLPKLLKTVNLKELKEIEIELAEGKIQDILKERLASVERAQKTCPVCNRLINSQESFSLEFGPPDLRQRATFDGMDCLEYFIHHVKEQKEDEYY